MGAETAKPTNAPGSFLSRVTSGKIKKPNIFLIYGPEGSGKSTFGSEAEAPIFLEGEEGTKDLNVNRLPRPKTWDDVMAATTEIVDGAHDFKTLVVDTVDWLEPLNWRHVCLNDPKKPKNIDEAAGGYNKGYGVALELWREFYTLLAKARDIRDMTILVLAHAKAIEFNDPATLAPYMRYTLGVSDRNQYSAAKFWKEAADGVFFLNRDISVAGKDKGARGLDDGLQYLFTERRPAFDAKNRLGLPEKIMLPRGASYKALMDAIANSNSEDPEVIIRNIKNLQDQLAVPEQKALVTTRLAEYGKDVDKLKVLRGKVETILQQAA
jgi:AAA domain-containing protein